MERILVYTFFNYSKKTSRGLFELESTEHRFDKLYVPGRFATKNLLEKIADYDIVIGIGDHNRNAIKSRIDPGYVNKYGKRTILENGLDFVDSNLEILLPNTFYTYTGTTNGPCNRSAYLVMNKILIERLSTRFAFFHLCPKRWEDDLKVVLSKLRD